MQDKPDLAPIASRICHDLISPIGAIGNGVEPGDGAGSAARRWRWISESVANANARIRFFRICFCRASSDQRIARSEVASIPGRPVARGRVGYSRTSPADLSRREVRLVFLLLQCPESALAYGGRSASPATTAAGRCWPKRQG